MNRPPLAIEIEIPKSCRQKLLLAMSSEKVLSGRLRMAAYRSRLGDEGTIER
jgi:hypothetical protein